jgi:hypothetical protein
MKRIIKKIRRSLAIRMMLLFLVTAFVISFILHLTLGLALKNQFETRLMPHILQYQHYIRKEIGTPPSISRASRINSSNMGNDASSMESGTVVFSCVQ